MFVWRMCHILGFHGNSINNDRNSLTRVEWKIDDSMTGSELPMRAHKNSMRFNTNDLVWMSVHYNIQHLNMFNLYLKPQKVALDEHTTIQSQYI